MNGTVRKGGNMKVIRQLLKGSMKYFVLCILAGVLFTVCELVIPQILRVSVDSVIGTASRIFLRFCCRRLTPWAVLPLCERICGALRFWCCCSAD